jgi:hypothetical protein
VEHGAKNSRFPDVAQARGPHDFIYLNQTSSREAVEESVYEGWDNLGPPLAPVHSPVTLCWLSVRSFHQGLARQFIATHW